MEISRRKFLALTGFGSAAALGGSVLYRVGCQWRQSPAEKFRVLSLREASITRGIVDAVFPGEKREGQTGSLPGGLEVGLVEHFDKFLAGLPPRERGLMSMVLHAIEDIAAFGAFDWKTFEERPRSERLAIIEAWQNSRFLVRRAAVEALKYPLAEYYCAHPRVRGVLGIEFTCQ